VSPISALNWKHGVMVSSISWTNWETGCHGVIRLRKMPPPPPGLPPPRGRYGATDGGQEGYWRTGRRDEMEGGQARKSAKNGIRSVTAVTGQCLRAFGGVFNPLQIGFVTLWMPSKRQGIGKLVKKRQLRIHTTRKGGEPSFVRNIGGQKNENNFCSRTLSESTSWPSNKPCVKSPACRGVAGHRGQQQPEEKLPNQPKS
jgi:hypothetical protein